MVISNVCDSTNGDSERRERSEVGIIDSNANSQHRTICLFRTTQPSHHPEIIAPSVSHFLHCADSSYTESEILLVELQMDYMFNVLSNDHQGEYPGVRVGGWVVGRGRAGISGGGAASHSCEESGGTGVASTRRRGGVQVRCEYPIN